MTILTALVLLVVFGLGAPRSAEAADGQEAVCDRADVIFCENLEIGRTTTCLTAGTCPAKFKSPAPICCPPVNGWGTVASPPPNAPDGTKMYKASINCTSGNPPNNCGTGWNEWTITSPQRTLYLRYYFQLGAGFKVGYRNKIFETKNSTASSDQLFLGHYHEDLLFHVVRDGVGSVLDQNVNLPATAATPGVWRCLEFGVTMNSATGTTDGSLQGWVDDVQKWNYTNIGLVRYNGGPANLGFFRLTNSGFVGAAPGAVIAGDRYVDRIVIATQRIGCAGSTPTPSFALATTVSGGGTVTGAGSYPSGTSVTPLAIPNAGSTFTGWSGDCTGTGACTVTMTADKAVTATFTTPTTPPPTTNLPATPASPTVSLGTTDPSGATFNVAWAAVASATSYSYTSGLNDGSANQQGAVTPPNLLLKTPYMQNGAAGSGFVCIKSVNAAGSSAEAACNSLTVPAKPAVVPPQLTTGTLTADAQVSRCTYFLTAEPPDATGGWVAQFYRDGSTKVGNPISAAPYKRSVELFAPSHSFSAQFTKTGSVMRSPAVVTRVCP